MDIAIPDGWTVTWDDSVREPFRDPAFYDGRVATVTSPDGQVYVVEREGSADLSHEDEPAAVRTAEQFRARFPDGQLPEDGVDGWWWRYNAWFDVYTGLGEHQDVVTHELPEAVEVVFTTLAS